MSFNVVMLADYRLFETKLFNVNVMAIFNINIYAKYNILKVNASALSCQGLYNILDCNGFPVPMFSVYFTIPDDRFQEAGNHAPYRIVNPARNPPHSSSLGHSADCFLGNCFLPRVPLGSQAVKC